MYLVDLVTQDVDRAYNKLTHNWELKLLIGYRTQCTRLTGQDARSTDHTAVFPYLLDVCGNAHSVPGRPDDYDVDRRHCILCFLTPS